MTHIVVNQYVHGLPMDEAPNVWITNKMAERLVNCHTHSRVTQTATVAPTVVVDKHVTYLCNKSKVVDSLDLSVSGHTCMGFELLGSTLRLCLPLEDSLLASA